MQAVVVHQTGDADVLSLEEIEPPEPADGEVLIRVRAASVNPIDWKYRRGLAPKPLPAVLGQDVSGTVERSHADGLDVGDDVFGIAASGGYAEFATAQAAMIASKPEGVSHEQAAAIPVSGMTAWQALFDRAGLQAGNTILIAGAAGGVGHLAVQLAKYAGARVIGTGSSRNREFVLGIGADEYVDYTRDDVGLVVVGADIALDTVGGEVTESLLPALHEGGLEVTIAAAPPEEAARVQGKRAEALSMGVSVEQLSRIVGLVATGDVVVELAEVLPLTEVSRAQQLSETGHVRGKIVLLPGA